MVEPDMSVMGIVSLVILASGDPAAFLLAHGYLGALFATSSGIGML